MKVEVEKSKNKPPLFKFPLDYIVLIKKCQDKMTWVRKHRYKQ